jgi:GntR family transcriptional regulator/MocR family aminotransferase
MFLELDGNGDLYNQLARAIKRAILEGRMPVGTRLPSTRALAQDLSLSRNTVVTAYEMLHAEQLLESRTGAGTFVAAATVARPRAGSGSTVAAQSRYAARVRKLAPLRLRAANPALRYDLQYGEPVVDLRLTTAWRRALGRSATRSNLRYAPAAGLRELRQAISEQVGSRRGIGCTADDVIVVSGAQQAVSLAMRVLVDEGDAAAIEDPSYPLIDTALRAHGASVRSVPVDAAGLMVAQLPASGVRAVLVTPSHQFPSGAVMSIERRMSLLDYADRHGAWIIEDDYDGEFRFSGPLKPALRSLDTAGRVLYVGSFSKVLFPALRLGYVICPPGLRDDLLRAKLLDDLGCPGIAQLALADLIASGAFERHVRHATAELKRRRAALLAGLAGSCARHVTVHDSGAGMHVVGWLRGWKERDVKSLITLAQERGVGVQSIGPHFRRQPAPSGLLLGYAALSAKQLTAATALLAACLDAIRPR